jgi:mono/diheme cytochrome c family protein
LLDLSPLLACDSETDSSPQPEDDHPGARIYREPVSDGNSYSCASCHAITEPAADGLRRAGHALGDAAARPSFKNGQLNSLRDAVNSCLQEWMNAEPWTENDLRWLDFEDWLTMQAPAQAEPLSFEIVPAPTELEGGDDARGRGVFNSTCAICHGEDATGTDQGPALASNLEPEYIAERVRASGRIDSAVYPGLSGGVMPFWAADRFSDGELRDVIAWLGEREETPIDPETSGGPSEPPMPLGECGTSHERIGWKAELQRYFHNVAGTATIVDDCTIEIEDFVFDGGGIDVRIYGGSEGNYDDGFAMTDDLRNGSDYNGVTLVAKVPPGKTLEDVNGISVWCVAVGVNFGSGMFAPP